MKELPGDRKYAEEAKALLGTGSLFREPCELENWLENLMDRILERKE